MTPWTNEKTGNTVLKAVDKPPVADRKVSKPMPEISEPLVRFTPQPSRLAVPGVLPIGEPPAPPQSTLQWTAADVAADPWSRPSNASSDTGQTAAPV